MSNVDPLFSAEGLCKNFSSVQALSDVTLEVRPGEVLALIGENGAGKSTLLKILSGDHQPDAGQLVLDGRPTRFPTPADARKAGVRVIYQEPEIVQDVSVAENVYIGGLPHDRIRRFDRRRAIRKTQEDLDRAGFAPMLRAETLGRRLSSAQRQLVEILRGLTTGARVVCFDEPTSSLSDVEVEALFKLIGRLRDAGVGVVYVSHRMQEIFRVADRVAVLRDGRLVGTRNASETNEDDLVKMMVGRDLTSLHERNRNPEQVGRVVLDVTDLNSADVHDINLQVRAGEIAGIAGLVGAGRSELAHTLVGDFPLHSGQVRLSGTVLRLRNPGHAVRAGIGFAPEERKAEALIMERTVRENTSLAVLDRIRRWRFVNRGQERALVQTFMEKMRVRTPSMEQEIRKLSGGNQQKVVLARWLARRPQLLILDEPTRGVDVGAKAEIYHIIDELAKDGVAVLVISSDLPEVLGLSDRIVVMKNGRIAGELSREDATEERILGLAVKDHSQAEGEVA